MENKFKDYASNIYHQNWKIISKRERPLQLILATYVLFLIETIQELFTQKPIKD